MYHEYIVQQCLHRPYTHKSFDLKVYVTVCSTFCCTARALRKLSKPSVDKKTLRGEVNANDAAAPLLALLYFMRGYVCTVTSCLSIGRLPRNALSMGQKNRRHVRTRCHQRNIVNTARPHYTSIVVRKPLAKSKDVHVTSATGFPDIP